MKGKGKYPRGENRNLKRGGGRGKRAGPECSSPYHGTKNRPGAHRIEAFTASKTKGREREVREGQGEQHLQLGCPARGITPGFPKRGREMNWGGCGEQGPKPKGNVAYVT